MLTLHKICQKKAIYSNNTQYNPLNSNKMKKVLFIAVIALCMVGCCKKADKKQCCEGEKTECCEKKAECQKAEEAPAAEAEAPAEDAPAAEAEAPAPAAE